MDLDLIIKFLVLTAVISGALIFALHRVFISSVDGAKQRLDKESEAARARQAELGVKIKEADEELSRRKQEADALEKKMKFEMESGLAKEKEAILTKARTEGEEIIAKAQASRDNIRKEVEKNIELKIVDYSSKILGDILSDKARNGLDQQLLADFVEKLKNVDMSKIGPDVITADLVTVSPADQKLLSDIEAVLQEKLKRKVTLKPKADGSIIGGAVLQFGSLLLDGSLKSSIRSSAISLKQDIEKA
jgi:F0F1-type ATP synthase membrane subunit b/b'